jgi:hypothetical protein
MNTAHYFFVCDVHGGCGNAPVHHNTETARQCPVCGGSVEVWIGTHAPPHKESHLAERRAS